jgi:phosphoribosylformylglycinamidine synthase
VRQGGIAAAVSRMCFGNMLGFEFSDWIALDDLFNPLYGSLIIELSEDISPEELLKGISWRELGRTKEKKEIKVNNNPIRLDEMLESWEKPLEHIFPTRDDDEQDAKGLVTYSYTNADADKTDRRKTAANIKVARPRVFIPVFPGTNCEYDTAKAFQLAGGEPDVMVIRNLTPEDIGESIRMMEKKIRSSQIIMIPGGFSAGDEPEGSGKFIATAFRNPYISEAVMDLIKNRDGLILGICNGFQALIKLGLVPYGEIRDMKEDSPTLTYNSIGRHISCMVNTRIASNLSPWFSNVKTGDIHTIAVSHGEGRFVAKEEDIRALSANGQIAAQYVDIYGNASSDIRFNPNGSMHAIEGITSPDGRVLGKMGHSERVGSNVGVNVPGNKDQKLFEAGVGYFL